MTTDIEANGKSQNHQYDNANNEELNIQNINSR